MAEQKITATLVERTKIRARHLAAEQATKQAAFAQQISIDVFEMFCEARGLPKGTELVGVDGEDVIVAVPEPGPAPPKLER